MNLPIFGSQPKISTKFFSQFFSSPVFNVLFTFRFTEFHLRAGGQLLLRLSWVFVNKLKIPSKNCKSVTPANSSRQKWRMDILEVTIIFSWFFTDCLYHSEHFLNLSIFLAMWKPIPKLCHQTRLAKLSQWLIIYWRRKTTLGNGNRRQKARDEVWDSFQQLYLFGVKVSMWPNVINLVVIHTLFVYAAVLSQPWESHENVTVKLKIRSQKGRILARWSYHDLLMNASLFVLSISLLSFWKKR